MDAVTTLRPTWQRMGDRWYATTFGPGVAGGTEWDPMICAWRWYVYLGDDLWDEGRADTRTEAREAAEGSAERVMDDAGRLR